ncbi:unnamed protein product [Rotaria sp. Silwood2]|nr:unnamed protein product [Rotaria sp. Silwood2]CAF2936654.1 unnamed protein product [Rotaria sp. Silwood2]CAF3068482.1 unnamed protein product [Rotaria sp. Silwood2]CAF3228156.1 unnamed protein product [Rotaria sp. Silwood2]CAF4094472.1 unnamed protein product [Rotaria sp. Silwood2]
MINLKTKSPNNQTTSAMSTSMKTNSTKSYALPMDQLKRAVRCNLPCFMIDFHKNIAPRDLPSAIIVCDLIQEHFNKNKMVINDFSVAAFTGHRLKLGVNNMEDYSKLARTDVWPTSNNGKKMNVVKPKFIPGCFSLVVRYATLSNSI